MVQCVVKLHSEIRKHGLRDEAVNKKVSKPALVARGARLMNIKKEPEKRDDSKREKRPRDHEPRKYNGHDGTIHSMNLLNVQVDDLEGLKPYWHGSISAMVSAFNNLESWDLQARKNAYADGVNEVLQKFGENVLVEDSTELDKIRAKLAFNYVESQIIVMVYSDEEFEGSVKNKSRNDFELVLLSKKKITTDLLDGNILKILTDLKDHPEKIVDVKVDKNSRPLITYMKNNGQLSAKRASDEDILNARNGTKVVKNTS